MTRIDTSPQTQASKPHDSSIGDGDTERVAAAVARARAASRWWQGLSVRQRAHYLLAYRDRLIDRLDDLLAVVGREINKPRFDIVNEAFQACALIGTLARRAPRWLRPRSVRPGFLVNKSAEIHHRPLGVVGAITPWNYPVVLVLDPVVQALVAGNTVVLKPSEWATQTARFLVGLFDDIGLAEQVVQVIEGGPAAALALAGADVDKIAFTGGTKAGQAILRATAERLTPVLLELGGNDAMLVAADADLERAAAAAVWGAFLNAGQSCISVERCYVERPVFDRFTALVVERTRALSQGLSVENSPDRLPTGGGDHDLGPMISPAQYQRTRRLVAEAVARGATILTGGVPPEEPGDRCFPPTVLTDLPPDLALLREEIFGPVLPILPVPCLEDALALANDSRYGLAASVWTADIARARRLADRLAVGGVVINDCLVHFAIAELPFGGVKQSGFNRTHGREGLYQFTATHTVTRHRFGPRLEPHWFPYGRKYHWMARLMRLLFRSGLARFFSPKR